MRKVNRLKEAGDVQGLIDLMLDFSTANDRPTVAAALAELGDPRAVEPLARMLNDPPDKVTNRKMRLAYAEALARIGGAEAAAALEQGWLSDSDYNVRKACLRGLGEDLSDPGIVAALLDALRHKDRYVRGDAAAALARMKTPEGLEAVIEAKRVGVDVPLHAARGRVYLDFLLGLGGADELKALVDEYVQPGEGVAFVLVGRSLPNLVIGLQDRLIAVTEPTRGPTVLGASLWVGKVPVKVMPLSEMDAGSIEWHPRGNHVTLGRGLKGVRYDLVSHLGIVPADQWKYYLDRLPLG